MAKAIKASKKDVELLARLALAEAEDQGMKGIQYVLESTANRVNARCFPEFENANDIPSVVYMHPGGYESTMKPYFYTVRAKEKDLKAAEDVIKGKRYTFAEHALWFFNPQGKPCPKTWWGQPLAGQERDHCFYFVPQDKCPELYYG